VLRGHAGEVNSAVFSPSGDRIVTASADKTARLWNTQDGQPFVPPLKHEEAVNSVHFSSDGALIVTGAEHTIRIWDARKAVVLHTIKFDPPGTPLKHVSFAAGDQMLIVVTDRGVRIYDVRTSAPLNDQSPYSIGSYRTYAAAVAVAGTRLAVAQFDDTFMVWDLPQTAEAVPAWLPSLVEALAGRRWNQQGLAEPVDLSEFISLRQTLLQHSGDDYYSRWASWFLAEGTARTISPDSQVSLREYVAWCLGQNRFDILQQASVLDPTNLTVLVAFARASRTNLVASDRQRSFANDPEASKRIVRQEANEAGSLADQLLNLDSDNAEALHLKAVALHRLDQQQQALEVLNRLKPEQQNVEGWKTRGAILEDLR
jgi:hypothetical protein